MSADAPKETDFPVCLVGNSLEGRVEEGIFLRRKFLHQEAVRYSGYSHRFGTQTEVYYTNSPIYILYDVR